MKISACTVPAWLGGLVPAAAVKLLLSMSTDSSAWTTALPLLTQCLLQRAGVQGAPASSIPVELLSLSPSHLGRTHLSAEGTRIFSELVSGVTYFSQSCFHLIPSMISQLAVRSGFSCGQQCDGWRRCSTRLVPWLLWDLNPQLPQPLLTFLPTCIFSHVSVGILPPSVPQLRQASRIFCGPAGRTKLLWRNLPSERLWAV